MWGCHNEIKTTFVTTPHTNDYLVITCIFWAFLSKDDKR